MLLSAIAAGLLLLASCGGPAPEKKAAAPPPKKRPAVADYTHRFPAADRIEAKVVEDHILGKDFLPGGNMARYRKGKQEYEMFLIRASVPEAAALMLIDYKKRLENPKIIAHFGGYYGKDGDRMVFVFAKGPWFAGVVGLPEKEADLAARDLAARLN
ncbi:MAG: hypothetical protein N2036_00275 [Bryobacteraceae bacterium]|nr:hypothetical protein [Bryobacteraceae bacterium]